MIFLNFFSQYIKFGSYPALNTPLNPIKLSTKYHSRQDLFLQTVKCYYSFMAIRSYKDSTPVIGTNSYIDETAVIIGDVQIGSDCSIWPLTVVRGDVNSIRIGNNTNIQDGSVLHVTHDGPYDYNQGGYTLMIGSNVTVGHNVILHGCDISNNCLIGMGSTIMDGVIIKSNTIIGAGSLVSPGKELDEGCLYVGRPVKKVRQLNAKEIESIQYSANHYLKLKNTYL